MSELEKQRLTYGEYLRVADLIDLQHPASDPPHHDELLFIIIHQTYELWFKQLLHELDAVCTQLQLVTSTPDSRDAVYEAARLLRRCTEIMRVLVEQFTILETMLPTHFLAFRAACVRRVAFNPNSFVSWNFFVGLRTNGC